MIFGIAQGLQPKSLEILRDIFQLFCKDGVPDLMTKAVRIARRPTRPEDERRASSEHCIEEPVSGCLPRFGRRNRQSNHSVEAGFDVFLRLLRNGEVLVGQP